MKAKIKFLIAVGFIGLFSAQIHSQEQITEAMLEDPQKQQEIFMAILNNDQLKEKFMDQMMKTKDGESSMGMCKKMMDNPEMMKMMMDNMMDKARNDSSMCRMMGDMMMDDDHMKDMMNKRKERELEGEDHLEMHNDQN